MHSLLCTVIQLPILYWEKCQRLKKIHPSPSLTVGKNSFKWEKCAIPGFRRPYFHPYFLSPLSLTLLRKKATCVWSHPSHCSLDGKFIFISTGNLCSAAVLLEVQSLNNLSRFDRPARLHRGERCSRGGHLIKANTYSYPPSSISNVLMYFQKIKSSLRNPAKASSKGKYGTSWKSFYIKIQLNYVT